jgi:hypothetical protein
MTVHPVTINLSEQVYRQTKRAAHSVRRPMDEIMAEQAQAVALLQHRGYDVSDPTQFHPLA